MHELYQMPAEGGRIDMLWNIPAEQILFNNTGSLAIYHDKKGGENEWRKHHQSSIARDIWIFNKKENSHKMLTDFYGEDRIPVFSPDEKSIYYLSELSGTFNIPKMNLENPKEQSAITKFNDHPVRFLSISDAGLMSFGYDGQLYTIKEGELPKKLKIQLRSQDVANKDSFIAINGGAQEMSISPNGKELSFWP